MQAESLTILDREAIVALTKLPRKFEVVDTPHGKFKVWQLYVKERDAWEASRKVGKNKEETNLRNIRASLLVCVLRNDDGSRMFVDGDIETLGGLPSDVADRLFAVGCKLNGLNKEDVEDLTKNSDETDGADSPSV